MTHSPRTPRARGLVLAGALAALSSVVAGCGHAPVRPPVTRATTPGEVTGANVSDLQRQLDETPPGPAARAAVRDAVARHLALRGVEVALNGDHEGALRRLAAALVSYTPEELEQGNLPDELRPLARAVLDASASRSDEAHALAAARVLMALHTPDPAARQEFDRIRDWGARNRQEFQRPWVAAGELSELYREAARVMPAADMLRLASEQIVARRRAAMTASQSRDSGGRMTFDENRQLQAGLRNAAIDLAVLYLRVGDLQEAANQVTALGGSAESGLASALGAIAQGEGGAAGLGELAARLERVDASAAAGVCRIGRRNHPADARFAQCLAISAAREQDLGLASAHLESAVELSPNEQGTLREAVQAAAAWLGRELGSDDLTPGRRAYDRARTLLDRWRTRYPRQSPPVAESDLEEAVAQLELSAGNLEPAREHLTRATQAQPPSRAAYYTLAEVAWRHGDGAAAARYLQQGLAVPLRPDESDSVFRPQFMVRQALAARVGGDDAASRRLLTEAGAALDALSRSASGHDLAITHLHRAQVLAAMGEHDRVRAALTAAMDAAPEERDVAARAVTFALSHGQWEVARDLDRVARAQLNLDRTWQVYFGLWGAYAARLGRLEDDGGARASLVSIARGATEMSPWTVRLAQRFVDSIDQPTLLRHAKTPGQRAEAIFYEALGKLVDGDVAGAEAGLQAVVQTEVLRYFEYDMAWEMLRNHARAAPATSSTTPGSTGGASSATVATP